MRHTAARALRVVAWVAFGLWTLMLLVRPGGFSLWLLLGWAALGLIVVALLHLVARVLDRP